MHIIAEGTGRSNGQSGIIIATTLAHAAKLLSADGKFALYEALAGHIVV